MIERRVLLMVCVDKWVEESDGAGVGGERQVEERRGGPFAEDWIARVRLSGDERRRERARSCG